MDKLKIETSDGDILFWAKVVPGSSRTVLAGFLDDMLKMKISSPPEKGKANKAVIGYLAEVLCVKKSSVSIISGFSNPVKKIKVMGITAEEFLKKLCVE